MNPFAVQGNWYRGNLHTHTTNSDGRYSPQSTVDVYAQAGYDFLALADHGRLTNPADLDHRGMVLVPAAELNGGRGELGQSFHLLCLGMRREPERVETPSAQEALDYARSVAELVFVAHPYWSSHTPKDLMAFDGYDGIEVFNTTCQRGIGRGYSEPHWDDLLARGRILPAIAVDDAHFGYWDFGGGWIMLRAPQLDLDSVMAALKAGHYYATQGPEIKDVAVVDGWVKVVCSPARTVAMVVPAPGRGWTTDRVRRGKDESPMTEAYVPLSEARGGVFRIEVIDEHGRRAWTNPMKAS
ncbi:MAG: CehA/McbA family metallohydrolase [Armatimonadetes bacterium]|nr:CehA/McbA family metallohydrolase [Armatimonadota bacterium]